MKWNSKWPTIKCIFNNVKLTHPRSRASRDRWLSPNFVTIANGQMVIAAAGFGFSKFCHFAQIDCIAIWVLDAMSQFSVPFVKTKWITHSEIASLRKVRNARAHAFLRSSKPTVAMMTCVLKVGARKSFGFFSFSFAHIINYNLVNKWCESTRPQEHTLTHARACA